jgi:stage II sporulation protein P
MSSHLVIISAILFFFSLYHPYTIAAFSPDGDELESGYSTIVDDNNTIISQLGFALHVGDRYISEDNKLYEIILIEGTLAKARFINSESSFSPAPESIAVQGPAADLQPLIAIYHSHTDESYIPNDANATTPGNGSIMLVGDSFSNRLKELGYQTIHSKTLHDPHDANAYQRSRRTFMELLKSQPAALFDLHRDSGPLASYQTTINGQDVARILLVVGRQNQNQATTLKFAKTIKASADATYRGLIRGIFIAHGNYNQDLDPRAMLVEMGTQYNTREAAERSAALFADIIPSIIAPNPPSAAPTPETTSPIPVDTTSDAGTTTIPDTILNTTYTYDIFAIIGTLFISILAYLYLSTGSWQEAKNKLYKFYKYEFTNFLGPRKKRND